MLSIEPKQNVMATGADLLIQVLINEKIDTIFGTPGDAILPIYDSLYDCEMIHHTMLKHEQAVVHAGDGYARATGKPGVCIITSGPGVTNAVTGIATAQMDSVPLLIIAGQVESTKLGSDSFREIDINGITMPLTKNNFKIRDAKGIPQIIKEALYVASSGRPGPVLIEIPTDILLEQAQYEVTTRKSYTPARVPQRLISLVKNTLNSAKKPVLMIGGGIISSDSTELLRELVDRTNIPVVSTLMGIGAFPSSDTRHLGMLGMHGTFAANKAVHKSDLLISLGVRFSDRVTGKKTGFSPNSIKIHVDVDAAEINKIIKADIPGVADLKVFLQQLTDEKFSIDVSEWLHETSKWQKIAPRFATSKSQLNPQEVIRMLDKFSEGDALVATDVGQHQIWTAHNYQFKYTRSFLSSGGSGTMGYGLPAAIGAAIAKPDRQVICISGDGSIQMNIQELITAVQNKLPIKIAILKNGYLGMVRQWQEMFYKRRYSSVNISSPDFVILAEAFGAKGFRASSINESEQIIRQAFNERGPVVMEFDVTEEENVYPIVPPGGNNMETIVNRDIHESTNQSYKFVKS